MNPNIIVIGFFILFITIVYCWYRYTTRNNNLFDPTWVRRNRELLKHIHLICTEISLFEFESMIRHIGEFQKANMRERSKECIEKACRRIYEDINLNIILSDDWIIYTKDFLEKYIIDTVTVTIGKMITHLEEEI